jgi:hypothetical protein
LQPHYRHGIRSYPRLHDYATSKQTMGIRSHLG